MIAFSVIDLATLASFNAEDIGMLQPNLNRVASLKLAGFSANLGEVGTASSHDPAALPCNDLSLTACQSEFVFPSSSDVMVLKWFCDSFF